MRTHIREKIIAVSPPPTNGASAMPFYLCENCARANFKPDVTLGGFQQLWLRVSKEPNGYGPPCELCQNSVTKYQLQIIGLEPDAEGQIVDKMVKEYKEKVPPS